MESEYTLKSEYDGLDLSVCVMSPEEKKTVGIVQLSHGMCEHKERYFPFMQFLTDGGYVTVIHDHRGHGQSVSEKEDLGFFYTGNTDAIVEDLHLVTRFIREKYPDIPLYLFSHSMGTLVARNYIKKYDDRIDGLVLSGPPTENRAVSLGLFCVAFSTFFRGERYRSSFIDGLATGGFDGRFPNQGKNAWLCSSEEAVREYNSDGLCGFTFTNNGFRNLFRLQKKAFSKKGWKMKNREMPILLIAGEDDPVIISTGRFEDLKRFLEERGYSNIEAEIYSGKRHELLNEEDNWLIYSDILKFIEKKGE